MSAPPGDLLKVISEHRDGGESGHDGLQQLVHPGGHPGELAGLRADHLDQLGDLATADGAELQQSLHTPPHILLGGFSLQYIPLKYIQPPTSLYLLDAN